MLVLQHRSPPPPLPRPVISLLAVPRRLFCFSLTFPGSRNTQKPQIWSETVFSIVRYEVSKRMEIPPDYPHTINFMFTKYSSLTPGSSFTIMSESIEFSFTWYPVFRLRHFCFYQQSIFVLYFLLSVRCLAWRTTKQRRHYWSGSIYCGIK